MQQVKRVLPTIILALGIVAATAITAVNQTSWIGYGGVVMLAFAIIAARALDRKWTTKEKGCWREALIVSSSTLVVGAALMYVNPSLLSLLIPMIGSGSFAVLSEPWKCFRRRNSVADREGVVG